MTEEQRITDLAARLLDDGQHGRRPSTRVSLDDACTIARGIQNEMDALVSARAQAAAEQGLTMACQKGCAHCCENLVMVFKGEAIAAAQWLCEPENQHIRQGFLDAYPRWREAVGDAPERARDASAGQSDADYMNAAMEVYRRGVMCAFNRDGLCTIYPVRPNACRNCHALGSSEKCQASNDGVPETLPFQPIESLRHNLRPLSEAVHIAVGGAPGVLTALCQEVYELLTSGANIARQRHTAADTKVGRNQPCPCGSGRKFKRCCG